MQCRRGLFASKQLMGGTTAELISKVLLDQLNMFCSPEKEMDRDRWIAQTFDEASVTGGAIGGVRRKVQDIYPTLHLEHCSRSRSLFSLDTWLQLCCLAVCIFLSILKKVPNSRTGEEVDAYSVLSRQRLQTERTLIYKTSDFRTYSSVCRGIVSVVLFYNSLHVVLSETLKLLRILITSPWHP